MIVPHDLGRARLVQGVPDGRPQKVLRIDATDAAPTLIGRLLVGSYITGQDQILVAARNGLSPEQRAEIRRVVDRLLGMTVVGETANSVEIQNFVDPSKHQMPRLLQRVVGLLRDELAVCDHALAFGETAPLARLDGLEEEVDQLYLLMARQLLLSSEDAHVAREIDVASRHYQVGYRLVAKALEVAGDLVHGVGTDLRQHATGFRSLPPRVAHELLLRIRRVENALDRTMEAFAGLSVAEADATLNRIAELLQRDARLGQLVARSIPDHRLAIAAQRIASHLAIVLEMLVIINEVTINRSVEPETVALTGSRVVTEVRRPRAPRPEFPH